MENEPRPQMTETAKLFNTREEAIEAIKKFWQTTQSKTFEMWKESLTDDNFGDELTSGDRTSIVKGLPFKPEQKGKWVAYFRGNNQPLSEKAVNYFKELEKPEEPPKE